MVFPSLEEFSIVCCEPNSKHEFEQALGVGDGQESLACSNPEGRKELDMTE